MNLVVPETLFFFKTVSRFPVQQYYLYTSKLCRVAFLCLAK